MANSTNYQKRSISLPCRSHPSTDKLEVELNKLQSWEISSYSTSNMKAIIQGVSGLSDLYRCVEDLLNLSMTRKALSHHQCEIYVDNLQDGFLSLLDICSIARDNKLHIKENGREIESSLRRRRKGDSSFETIISKNTSFRKKMIKDAKKMVLELKQMENKIGAVPISELDHHVSSVIRSLQEVIAMSFVVLNSVYMFSCAPIMKPKTRWSMVSKLMHKGAAVACENQIEDSNELQSLDMALDAVYKSASSELGDYDYNIQMAQNGLKSLDVNIAEIEDKIECLYRRIIKTRAYLLNIGSTVL